MARRKSAVRPLPPQIEEGHVYKGWTLLRKQFRQFGDEIGLVLTWTDGHGDAVEYVVPAFEGINGAQFRLICELGKRSRLTKEAELALEYARMC